MIPQKTYYIYCLKHPVSNEIKYIGVTSVSLKNRFYQHVNTAKNRRGTKVSKWIFSLLKQDLKPVIELIETCSCSTWEEREIYWISYYNNLLNQHKGGKGVVIDRTYSSIERSANAHKKPIVGLDKAGNFVIEFDSCREATRYFNFKSYSNISNSVRSKGRIKAKELYWFYKSDWLNGNCIIYPNKPKVDYSKLKKVYLYSKEGVLIKEYKCLYHLVNELSPTKKNYTAALKALSKHGIFKGYKISYNKL